MKAIIFEEFGDPANVLKVREMPAPEPGRGQVRVRMIASPINPSDLLYVRGEYGKRPQLPSSSGFEGVGIVEASGGGILGRMRMGRRVAVLNGVGGNWQEQLLVSARQVVPVPAGISDEQAASFFVNPASALIMTCNVLCVPPGAWMLQTAAGSALGQMIRNLGKHYGFKVINVVRRRDQAEELKKTQVDAVVCSGDESIEERVSEITGGQGVKYAIDAVGGETGSAVVRSLGRGGRLLVYGTLSEQPLSLSPRTLMVGQKSVEGFWLSEWVKDQSIITMLRLFRRIGKLMSSGVLTSEVGKSFAMHDVAAAVAYANSSGRPGKTILRFRS